METYPKARLGKLLVGLVESQDVSNFSVDRGSSGNVVRIQILVGNWTLEFLENGKWDIV